MPRFVKVKKSNRNRDRGFIAVDMICAAFENQDAGHTEIMTLDGFWYEVTEGIEELYKDVIGEKEQEEKANETEQEKKDSVSQAKFPTPQEIAERKNSKVLEYFKIKKVKSPSADDKAYPLDHEEVREQKRKRGVVPKRYFKKPVSTSSKPTESLPSGDGRGQGVTTTKAVDFTPHEPMGT